MLPLRQKILMSKEKPAIPKGTRDFSPEEVVKRTYIFDVIRRTFEKFGFLPLETPTMENLSVLTGKYGEEGDQLIFKILNSGDFLTKTVPDDISRGSKHLIRKISEKALRYDLTVPFARYVVMHRNEITFPFKRYQIQPVWRADRPQKGRYREFYQCDADVVGTRSLLCEAEIVLMIDEVLTTLGIEDFTIKINHRAILKGIHTIIGGKGNEADLLSSIDKLDKIGQDGVIFELISKGYNDYSIDSLKKFIFSNSPKGLIINDYQSWRSQIIQKRNNFSSAEASELTNMLDSSEINYLTGIIGFGDILQVGSYLNNYGFNNFHRLEFDISLARGLSYYTGCIFEVKVNNVSIGSISGGGRYDNLTGMFGLPDVPGVGFSFGVDRIYDVLEELKLFPAGTQTLTQVLIVNFDKASEAHALPVLQQLRTAGIASELYPDAAKLKKQMSYADQKHIPYVLLLGSEEIESGQLQLRTMHTGEQQQLSLAEVIRQLIQSVKA